MHNILRATARILSIGLIAGGAAAGLVYGIDHDPDLAPTVTSRNAPVTKPAPAVTKPAPRETISEDDWQWNCLTMGNKMCGPDWVPVDHELADALAEGDDDGNDYPWEACKVRFENEDGTAYSDATIVVCPDGKLVTS